VRWQLDEAALAHSVPALSIQPLVENSIKHAFNPRSAPGVLTIRVQLDRAAQRLQVSVSDNGPGSAPDVLETGSGLGLKTVSRRLALEFGAASGLRIDTRPGAGFSAAFSLPT
jgi:LytS/YehU family sensor histidine kinase